MILVEGYSFNVNILTDTYPEKSIERKILNTMFSSTEQYKYESLKTLMFELQLRKEIIIAARELNISSLSFSSFDKSQCNHQYWNRTNNGGFMLKGGTDPSMAIRDIFINGEKYATECATAMMIVYYKALLSVFQDELFNKVFSKIYLMDWDVREPLLKGVEMLEKVSDILLGDRGYFSNPEFAPEFSEWQGENVIVLPDSMYYGHGIGIATADQMIYTLNKKRKKGATKSAYFLDSVGRPNFKRLADTYYSIRSS